MCALANALQRLEELNYVSLDFEPPWALSVKIDVHIRLRESLHCVYLISLPIIGHSHGEEGTQTDCGQGGGMHLIEVASTGFCE